MSAGFRILKRRQCVTPDQVAAWAGVPLANISDVMSRGAAGGARLRPYHDGQPLAGAALTVRTRPGDNLMVHKAIDLSEPGDVLVIDAGGDLTNSILGELMIAQMKRRGVVGVVVDGAIRDLASIQQDSFPVYAAGVTHRGPYRDGPGEINVPVTIGGMIVHPGDLVLGDTDGLLTVGPGDLETVLAQAKQKAGAEERISAAIEAGTLNRAWVDETLTRLGCEFEP